MTDTTQAPERIWATGDNRNGSWTCEPLPEKWAAKTKEYICVDTAQVMVAERDALKDKLTKAVEAAFYEGFCEGRDGGWVWGDPTPAWNESEAKKGIS